ncbi:chemotaxis protein CheA [Clostridium tagluense]|uniref:chemotaxis protein CheA n=1 Tax=Clostridium tagluense TaxID=360422 RepID=UPI001CF104FE|nr:chemotaxis protein CheA [Clostridium tagluense]MCB2297377.1 chemotaxis protein CheA [Clostridium tagluense]
MAGIYESAEMLGAFLDEAEEQLQLLEQGILELEQGDETDIVIQNIFRAAHTLKGSSSAMGYEKMKQLTHEMENVLDKIRNNLLKVTKPTIDVLFQCADCLRLLKEDFVVFKNDTKIDISDVVENLKAIQKAKLDNENLESQAALAGESDIIKDENKEVSFTLGDCENSILENAVIDGRFCLVCEVKISEESFMKATRAYLILNALNDIGKVISSNPNVLELSDDADIRRVQYLMTSELDSKALELKANSELMDVDEVRVFDYKVNTKKQIKQTDKLRKNMVIIKPKTKESEKKASQTVRVDIERLEHMMNLVGEMVIEQTRIAQVSNTLHNRYAADTSVDDLIGISNHVSRVVSELQESVMKARMLPAQQLFNRFPRMVRDLGQSLNKEIDLILEGGETEMDRTIIEDITDPLIHLVRNSLDHGIEDSEIRKSKGKPEKGTLKIRAFHQENHVIITIEDDGAGLDLEKIKQSAIRKEIITAEEADSLSQHEIINLIFETGLSTTENVSDVSGRGVGMDIVRNHIDKLNGIIDIETREGEGTKVTVRLPLTLAILTGLLVKIYDETYALPMSNIIEIVRMPKNEIESVKKQSIVVIRGKVHSLVWLHDYFKLSRQQKKKNVFVVVLGVAEKRFGIVVDELVGNQEIVVKPLGSYIGKVEGLSGATILGDGSVACIFDVVGLSRMISSRVAKEINNEIDAEK